MEARNTEGELNLIRPVGEKIVSVAITKNRQFLVEPARRLHNIGASEFQRVAAHCPGEDVLDAVGVPHHVLLLCPNRELALHLDTRNASIVRLADSCRVRIIQAHPRLIAPKGTRRDPTEIPRIYAVVESLWICRNQR